MENEKLIKRLEKMHLQVCGDVEKAGGSWTTSHPEGGFELYIKVPKAGPPKEKTAKKKKPV